MVKKTTAVYEVFTIWEYEYGSYEKYEKIEKKVINDEEHVKRVQNWHKKMGGKENLKRGILENCRRLSRRDGC